jgi:hypothetical protein
MHWECWCFLTYLPLERQISTDVDALASLLPFKLNSPPPLHFILPNKVTGASFYVVDFSASVPPCWVEYLNERTLQQDVQLVYYIQDVHFHAKLTKRKRRRAGRDERHAYIHVAHSVRIVVDETTKRKNSDCPQQAYFLMPHHVPSQ